MNAAPDHLPLHVETAGSTGRSVLLVHGFGANSYTWRHWVGPLSADHRVHLVDMMGHGAAPAPADGDYSPTGHADLVRRYIVSRSLEGVTLVGHSLGGGVALLAALELLDTEPHRLDSLILVSSASLPQELPTFIGWARKPLAGEAMLSLVPKAWLIRKVLRSIVHDPEAVRAGQVDAYAAPLRSRAKRRALLETARKIVPPDLDGLVERYPEIDVPALLVWGRQDPVVPLSVGESLAGILPAAELHVLEGCGHIPPAEAPRASLAPVKEFLARRAPTT